MSIFGRLIAVLVFTFSSSVFADTYNAVYQFWYSSNPNRNTFDLACNDVGFTGGYPNRFIWNKIAPPLASCITQWTAGTDYTSGNTRAVVTISSSSSCPYGGTVTGTFSTYAQTCTGAPSCVAPQVRNSSTGMCVTPPTCLSGQILNTSSMMCVSPTCTAPKINSTVTGFCINPPGGIDCYNGSTVYIPMVCPVNPLDAIRESLKPPAPGEIKTCKDGSVITYPTTCYTKFLQDIMFAAGTGSLKSAQQLLSESLAKKSSQIQDILLTKGENGEYQLKTDWKHKIDDIFGFSRDVQTIPKGVVADSVEVYKNGVMGVNFLDTIASNSSGELVAIEKQLYPIGSPTALTPNQVLQAMEQYNVALPTSVDFTSRIPFESVLGLENSLTLAAEDFYRIYDRDPATVPLKFPAPKFGISPGFAPDPAPDELPIPQIDPLPDFRPDAVSPLIVPAPLPQNPNQFQPLDSGTGLPIPNAQPSPEQPYTVEPPGESPVMVPTLENDKSAFFPWLNTENPFFFSPTDFLPSLPDTSCNYEIHQTFHVPILGNKSFDFAPCAKLAPLRAVLAWVFSVVTALAIFFIVFRTTAVL